MNKVKNRDLFPRAHVQRLSFNPGSRTSKEESINQVLDEIEVSRLRRTRGDHLPLLKARDDRLGYYSSGTLIWTVGVEGPNNHHGPTK